MNIEIVSSPKLLLPEQLTDRTVVVLDVLRATTTMIAALAAGAREIHVFEDLEETRAAAMACGEPRILCGERRALPPPGFDMGNSPGDFIAAVCCDKTLFMTTTNGTPAIVAAAAAPLVLIGAVANCSAVADRLLTDGRDATILCAGQRGDVALEDLLGAGSIIAAAMRKVEAGQFPRGLTSPAGRSVDLVNDAALMSLELFNTHRGKLGEIFRKCRGARAELNLGLSADIDFCAVEDRFNVIGTLNGSRTVRRLED